MKKLITILTLLLISQVLRAQTPQATSYQAVIRNSIGNVLSNQLVKVRFSIRDSAANGTVVYQETQTPTTNAQGLINLFAGQGTAVIGTFAGINWGSKSKFLQTEIDIAGGNNFTNMGTMQLMSVPYALFSNNGNPNGTTVGEMLYWNGTSWVKINPGVNGQNLTFCNGVPQWGPCLILPTDTTASAVVLPSVTIGTQVWTTQNLSLARYRNGDVIPQITDAAEWEMEYYINGAWCWYNNDSATYASTYGRLYNWKAVNDPRGLAPQGYHIPTDGDWNKLVKYLDAGADTICLDLDCTTQSTIAGGAMKSTTGWNAPNTGATNSSGFAGLPGGYRIYDGSFINIGINGIWWSSTEDGTGTGNYWLRSLQFNSSSVSKSSINFIDGYGLSVRCVRDTTIIPSTSILTTTIPTNITSNAATSGGNVTSDGGATITARGICWSTTANPTIALTTKTNNGTGAGVFTSNITGLISNTTYYVRAYATNSAGTAYGTQQTFTTASAVVLPSVTIGTQVWTTQNLSVARYRNGDVIPQVTDATQWENLSTGAWCWYNNDSATYAATYGRLYNWYAVNDARGLAPQGWHVSSDAEWNKLVKYLDAGADTTCYGCFQSTTAGGALKSTTGWDSPNTGATNSSGFAGLPDSYRNGDGSFFTIGFFGYWWSSTVINTVVRTRQLYFNNSNVTRDYFTMRSGLSVRCIRD